MLKIARKLILKYREALAYLVLGAITTLVNYVVYFVWMCAFTGAYANVSATLAAWVIAVLFAYFTNRKWVFKSGVTGFIPKLRECGAFFASRAFTGLLDLGWMYLTVDVLGFNGGAMKLLSNMFVVIGNYALSKLVIFRKLG